MRAHLPRQAGHRELPPSGCNFQPSCGTAGLLTWARQGPFAHGRREHRRSPAEGLAGALFHLFPPVGSRWRGNTGWQPALARTPSRRHPTTRSSWGGGGHGLSTAYYLAKEHGLTNIAVVEKGYLGSGNVGRNTTIIRSNYLLPGNIPFYEHSLKLWEGLEQDINYNAMVSQRGVLHLFESDGTRDAAARRGNAMRLEGVDAELLDKEGVRKLAPMLDFDNARFPVMGGLWQPRGGTVRHDAVAWGYARAADRRGGWISSRTARSPASAWENGRVLGVETTRGFIGAPKVGLACAGNSSRVAAMAGLQLPIESHVLQAFVSEGVKPLVDQVIIFGAGHFYVSQSDKGGLVFGGDIDRYNSYAQRGNLPVIHEVMEAAGRAHAVRQPAARPAPMGRHHGHVDGRLPHHRQDADRGPLRQLRLVHRRLQGDARLRVVFRPHDRPRRAAPPECRLSPRPLRHRRPHRRGGHGRHAEPALRAGRTMRIPCPHCGERGHEEFLYLGDAGARRPDGTAEAKAGEPASRAWMDYVYLRPNLAGVHRERVAARAWPAGPGSS